MSLSDLFGSRTFPAAAPESKALLTLMSAPMGNLHDGLVRRSYPRGRIRCATVMSAISRPRRMISLRISS